MLSQGVGNWVKGIGITILFFPVACHLSIIYFTVKENNKSKYETTMFWVDMGSSGESGSKDHHISEQFANI